MKTIKISALVFASVLLLNSCKKDTCSTCVITITAESTHPLVPYSLQTEVTQEEFPLYGDCEMTHEDFIKLQKDEMDKLISGVNSLNPYIYITSDFQIAEYEITESYTISCTEE